MALLSRANSIGPASDATDGDAMNPRFSSAQASPMVARRSITMPVNIQQPNNYRNMSEERKIGKIKDMIDPLTATASQGQEVNGYNAHCQVTTNTNPQWSQLAQQTAAVAEANDFGAQTKALNDGLTRVSK